MNDPAMVDSIIKDLVINDPVTDEFLQHPQTRRDMVTLTDALLRGLSVHTTAAAAGIPIELRLDKDLFICQRFKRWTANNQTPKPDEWRRIDWPYYRGLGLRQLAWILWFMTPEQSDALRLAVKQAEVYTAEETP